MKAGRSLTRSSHSLVGCLVSAAVRALPSATSGVVGPAPSSRSSRYGTPASSTIAIDTFHLFLSASALQAAIIVWASSVVRQGLVRMSSPGEKCGDAIGAYWIRRDAVSRPTRMQVAHTRHDHTAELR